MTQTQRRARIAGVIRMELARRQMSQTTLAKGAGITPASLSRRMQGKYPFYLEQLEAIAQFLGFDVSELTARTDEDAA